MESSSTTRADRTDASETDRRRWLGAGATAAMFAGLGASYGTLAAMAGRFLFTVEDDKAWLFVVTTAELPPGESLEFESPTGVRVTVTRRADAVADAASGAEPTAADFSALSSVCPHLGCRVHWEGQNRRYFCPCHNGVFDPEGIATEGPPAAAKQRLPRYPLRVENGMVFLEMPMSVLGDARQVFVSSSATSRDSHVTRAPNG